MTNNDVIVELTRLLPPDSQHPWKHTHTGFGIRAFEARLPNGRPIYADQSLECVVIGHSITTFGSGKDFASAVADFLASMSGAE